MFGCPVKIKRKKNNLIPETKSIRNNDEICVKLKWFAL